MQPAPAPPPASLGEIDPDVGPTFVLKGRVVTMAEDGRVLDPGRVVVSRGRVVAVAGPGERLPAGMGSAPEVDTEGTVYPGLMDLHSHFVYNVLPLWEVPKRFSNRTAWPRERAYASEVSLPIRAMAAYSKTARAIVRYVEAKAVAGGTTTGQGIRTFVRGGARLFRGAMRNVEETNDPRLPEAGTRVPNLGRRPVDFDKFGQDLRKRAAAGGAYFYHLAEGVDEAARRTFLDLRDNDLLAPGLVGIHGLGLQGDDFTTLAERGVGLVWSPFSNLLLYGATLDLEAVWASRVVFSIGSDWSPTGSKNLLQELKVARFEARRQGAGIASADLVRAVTADAARLVGWQRHLGEVRSGALADLVVVAGHDGDPYDDLIDATEGDVRLVVTHGGPRYGDGAVMAEVLGEAGGAFESWTVEGVEKALQLTSPSSPLEALTLADARGVLEEAMADLPAFRAAMEEETASLLAAGVEEPQPFTVELDNEYVPTEEELLADPAEAGLLADWDLLAQSVELDAIEVSTPSYWERIEAQANIGPELKGLLRHAYER